MNIRQAVTLKISCLLQGTLPSRTISDPEVHVKRNSFGNVFGKMVRRRVGFVRGAVKGVLIYRRLHS